jgi:hypothetical protein
VWLQLGRVEEMEKRWAEAAAAYRRVLHDHADSPAASDARKRLERLMATRPELASPEGASPPVP